MNATRTLIVAALTVAGAVASFGAQADEADGSQFATQFNSTKTRAEVQADMTQFKKQGTSVWSTQYNPLAKFESQRSRVDVQADFIANRDAVAAMTSEDSGSAYLAKHDVAPTFTRYAGTPVNGQ
ncbi:MAG: DUF4148 domain-containing protein [Ramlibacter sp.]|nr:DUF4148 domain-containing protein [Ramlibacter sp.]